MPKHEVEEIEHLLLRQKTLATYINNFVANTKKLKAADAFTVSDYQNRLRILHGYWQKFEDNNMELCPHTETLAQRSYFSTRMYEKTLETYSTAVSQLEGLMNSLLPPAPALGQPEGPRASASSYSHLERVKLPTFDGDQRNWQGFSDKFRALVINDNYMMPVIKMQHLINCLTGEPADLLRRVKVEAGNFNTAWGMLTTRYDDKLLRCNTHLKAILELPSAQSESVSHLNLLISTVSESIAVFEALEQDLATCNALLVYCITSKLPMSTQLDWAKHCEQQNVVFATYDALKSFIDRRVKTLDRISVSNENASTNETSKSSSKPTKEGQAKRTSSHAATNSTANKPAKACGCCSEPHYTGACRTLLRKSVAERRAFVRSAKLCFNCLSPAHRANDCHSKQRCRACQAKHHTTLHMDGQQPTETASSTPTCTATSDGCQDQEDSASETTACAAASGSTRLLATAIVTLVSRAGLVYQARALLDSCSEESFVAAHVVKALNAVVSPTRMTVNGVGDVTSVSRGWVDLTVKSNTDSSFKLQFKALTLEKLTSLIPSATVKLDSWPHLQHLKLADPHCGSPGRIDCLLGSEVLAATLRPGFLSGPAGTPSALHTAFGWVLIGGTRTPSPEANTTQTFALTVDQELSVALQRFWEIEELESPKKLSPDEAKCDEHFKSTVKRDSSGRIVVRLPFLNPPCVSGSREAAIKSLQALEKRLARNVALRQAYCDFMQQYEDLGHMKLVPPEQESTEPSVYIPHHPVLRDGLCAKIRVVFNASFKDASGRSLNGSMRIGPNLLADLRAILLRWRMHEHVFVCDIVKMFRQFLVDHADVDWQRIVWRRQPDGPICHYRLLTVTYGTASAPFLANACMLALAEWEAAKLPLGASIIRNNRYADDFFAGDDAEPGLCRRAEELIAITAAAGMSVGKWATNSEQVKKLIQATSPEPIELSLPVDTIVSTLGMLWNPFDDQLLYKVKEADPTDKPITKRQILSEVARLYDPLGLLAPVIIRAKILLQGLWLLGIDWDHPLEPSLLRTWTDFRADVRSLSSIRAPRWLGVTEGATIELHGFSDASEKAYSAAVYMVVRSKQGSKPQLLIAKSRVSPIKVLNIPRLELCGAQLLAQLLHFVITEVITTQVEINCWTDSQVVLAWLRGHPVRWKTFTANRVSEIHTLLPSTTWRHVPSAQNPADCASRGCTAAQLQHHALWWHGPAWLPEPKEHWPISSVPEPSTELEMRSPRTFLITVPDDVTFWQNWLAAFSSLAKIVRILAYIHRFVKITATPSRTASQWLSAAEISAGRVYLWRLIQQLEFPTEYEALLRNRPVSPSSRLRRLNPFMDTDYMIRVGGRLQNSALAESEKHPIILPAKHPVIHLLIREMHLATLHGGPLLTFSTLNRQYWLLRGRNTVRNIVRQCVTCARHRSDTSVQLMGPLPQPRVQPSRPFTHTGVDYAGPIWYKSSPGRGKRAMKGYLAIFVCLSTKSVHMEIVSDYSSPAFLAAFRRFTARRGLCRALYSDNGTTFQGADAELRRLFRSTSAVCQEAAAAVAQRGIEWHFIPPSAPHFGGLWEAAVKSCKHHLKRVMGDLLLTYEELSTLTTQIEACLNSRPISAVSTNEEDAMPLTPGHFLIGSALISPPDTEDNVSASGLNAKWARVQGLRDAFWARWSSEYLSQLQQRHKWQKERPNIQLNDIVLVKNELQPSTKWLMGRVIRTYPGKDGLIRVAEIKTAESTLRRPIAKLVVLPVYDKYSELYKETRLLTAGGNTPKED